MDSDSDLQAYINELSKKTHDLQYGDNELSSDDKSEQSQSSFSEITLKKSTNAENIKKQSNQTNKVKELEEKYLKRTRKSIDQNFSLSFSDYNLEFEEDKLNTDNILTFPEEMTPDSNTKAKIRNQEGIITETSKVNNTQNSVYDKGSSQLNGVSLKSQNTEEEVERDSSIASIKHVERKLSDNSSALNKGSIFYSTNDKAAKQKFPGKIIFRTRSSTLSESDTIKSDVPSSVTEEIPDFKQSKNINGNPKATVISKEDKVENHNYEENTFENSEYSSTIKSEYKNSKNTSESVSVNKSESTSHSKSATKTTISEHSSSEVVENVDDASEIVQSLRDQSSASLEESGSCSRDAGESSRSKSDKDSSSETENTSIIFHDRSSLSEAISPDSESAASESDQNLPKNSKNHYKLRNIIEKGKRSKKDKEHNTKKEEESGTRKKGNKRSTASSSTSSSSSSTIISSSSSTSSSFYVKMKKKKYREKKRKLKQEKELTELIIKLLIKNLPMILQQSFGLNTSPEILHRQQRYVCHHCGETSAGVETTQRRIDDALRQTVALTRQFMESHKALMETQFSHHYSSYTYTTLKKFH